MSTRFTIKDAPQTIDASARQPLGQLLINATQWMSVSLLHLMRARGHSDLSSAHLAFFCSLDCGTTHASNVARRMGISRQAVYKTTKELQHLGVLELLVDPSDRRQKVISMTKRGERIALDARASMAEVEKHLEDQIGIRALNQLTSALADNWGPIVGELPK